MAAILADNVDFGPRPMGEDQGTGTTVRPQERAKKFDLAQHGRLDQRFYSLSLSAPFRWTHNHNNNEDGLQCTHSLLEG
jgi:hypothetical protein